MRFHDTISVHGITREIARAPRFRERQDLQRGKGCLSGSINGYPVYFHQPAGAADRGFQHHMRHCDQRRVHQPVPDRFPVRPVAQVHYGLLQVGQASPLLSIRALIFSRVRAVWPTTSPGWTMFPSASILAVPERK